MPPPGYERAKKMQEQQDAHNTRLDRDSITVVDTVAIFDPATYEQEIQVITSKMSVRDYVTNVFGMANPEILLDHKPHIIIDPRTYENITIRLTPGGTIEIVLPKD